MIILLKHLFVSATFILSFFLFVKPDKAVEFSSERTDFYKFVPKESFTFLYRVVGLALMIVIIMMIVKHQI